MDNRQAIDSEDGTRFLGIHRGRIMKCVGGEYVEPPSMDDNQASAGRWLPLMGQNIVLISFYEHPHN